jgi:hypothetical protein
MAWDFLPGVTFANASTASAIATSEHPPPGMKRGSCGSQSAEGGVYFDGCCQNTEGVVDGALGLVEDLLVGAAQDDRAGLAAGATGETNHLGGGVRFLKRRSGPCPRRS